MEEEGLVKGMKEWIRFCIDTSLFTTFRSEKRECGVSLVVTYLALLKGNKSFLR